VRYFSADSAAGRGGAHRRGTALAICVLLVAAVVAAFTVDDSSTGQRLRASASGRMPGVDGTGLQADGVVVSDGQPSTSGPGSRDGDGSNGGGHIGMPTTLPSIPVTVPPVTVTIPPITVPPLPLREPTLAFRFSDGASNQLVAVREDGTGGRRLTSGGFDNLPRWSPDGSHLAFSRNCPPGEIHVLAADGSDDRTVGSGCDAHWSPDGRQLAFADFPAGASRPQIYVVNADGSGRHQVGSEPEGASQLAWSPEGRQLAYATDPLEGSPRLKVMDADGSHARQLSDMPLQWGPLDWSSRNAILFESAFGSDPELQLFSIGPDGSQLRQLTSLPGEKYYVAWSPDGSRVAFSLVSQNEDQVGLWVVDAGGANPHRVTGLRAGGTWSPDGKHLAFVTFGQGDDAHDGNLDTVGVDGTDHRRVVSRNAVGIPTWRRDPSASH
jgi:Tol biopolymer transport system component